MILLRKYYLSRFLSLLLIIFTSACLRKSDNDQLKYQKICIIPPDKSSFIVNNAIGAFKARVEQNSPAKIVQSQGSALKIRIRIKAGIGNEGFIISNLRKDEIEIVSNDEPGVLYGLGKLLHASKHTTSGFIPDNWRGQSVPACKVRGIYMACHFNNFYEVAPLNEIQTYIEDLAFAGMNSIVFNFPQWQYDSFSDTSARANIDRIRALMKTAKQIGLKVGLLEAENQGFRTAPSYTLNEKFPDDWKRRGNLGTSLCPSKKAGYDYLIDFWEHLLDEFKDIGLDYLVFWPYDEGGCGCSYCWPWGAKGHIRLSKSITRLARERWPECQTVISTWMYDSPPAGEWEGLYQAMKEDPELTNFIMTDAHESFPPYPLENPVPNDIPLINFPEISMWKMWPWGGYGANPLPSRLDTLWNQVSDDVDGGFPYSEGIYEDMNKFICLQFYWNPMITAKEAVKAYIAAYFSTDLTESISEAVTIMERNHGRTIREQGQVSFRYPPDSTLIAFEIMNKADQKLTPQVRKSWRWRLLYLRALIDDALVKSNGRLEGEKLKQAFDEIIQIYHAHLVHTNQVAPPKMIE